MDGPDEVVTEVELFNPGSRCMLSIIKFKAELIDSRKKLYFDGMYINNGKLNDYFIIPINCCKIIKINVSPFFKSFNTFSAATEFTKSFPKFDTIRFT